MLSMSVSEFRANMNTILKQVQNREIVSLLLRGNEIAKLVPPHFAQTAARQELATVRQTAVVGDTLAPVNVNWQAARKA